MKSMRNFSIVQAVIVVLILLVMAFCVRAKLDCDKRGGILIETGYGPSCVTNAQAIIIGGGVR